MIYNRDMNFELSQLSPDELSAVNAGLSTLNGAFAAVNYHNGESALQSCKMRLEGIEAGKRAGAPPTMVIVQKLREELASAAREAALAVDGKSVVALSTKNAPAVAQAIAAVSATLSELCAQRMEGSEG